MLRVNTAKIGSLTSTSITSLVSDSDAIDTDLTTLAALGRVEVMDVSLGATDSAIDCSTLDSTTHHLIIRLTQDDTGGHLVLTNIPTDGLIEIHAKYHATRTFNIKVGTSTVVAGQNKTTLLWRDTGMSAQAVAYVQYTPTWKSA